VHQAEDEHLGRVYARPQAPFSAVRRHIVDPSDPV
jgi:hypothetical protein